MIYINYLSLNIKISNTKLIIIKNKKNTKTNICKTFGKYM